jgi:serine protease Do
LNTVETSGRMKAVRQEEGEEVKRTTGLLMPIIMVIAMAGAAQAQTSTPSATTSPTQVSTTTKVQAYVQPAITYDETKWSFYAYDTYNKHYIPTTDNPKLFTVTFQCTGFVVNPGGYIATAGHCVDPKEPETTTAELNAAAQYTFDTHYYKNWRTQTLADVQGFAKDDYRLDGLDPDSGVYFKGKPIRSVTVAWGVAASGIPTGKSLPALVVKFQTFTKGDGALLKIDATNLSALQLAQGVQDIGTPIVAIGYPASVDLVTDNTFTPTFASGTITGQKTVQGGLVSVYEIDAAISGGMSGGPTVNEQGQVIGVNSFLISGESQPFNFVRQASIPAQLLGDQGVTNETGPVQTDYVAGLNAYFAGDRSTAIAKFNAVLDAQPSHELAQTYKTRALALPISSPPKSSNPPWLLIIGVVIVLIVVAGGIYWWARGRQPEKEPVPAVVGASTPTLPPTPEPSAPTEQSPSSKEGEKFCPNCGTAHAADAAFCSKCGHRFD